MDALSRRGHLPELEDVATGDLMRGGLQAMWHLAEAEIALAKDEMQEQFKAALRACIWGTVAVVSCVLSLTALLMVVALVSPSQVLVLGIFATFTAVVSLVTGIIACRMRPRQLLRRTQQRLEHEAGLVGKHLT
jgi:uncharacterized membrane protein YqjE